MKKLKYLLLVLLLIPFSSKAATINCSAPGTVVSGNTFTVTFSGYINNEATVWFGKIGNDGNASYVSGSLNLGGVDGKSMSRTITYKAGNPGTAKFYIYDMDVADDVRTYTDSQTCTVTVVAANSSNSNNNNRNNNRNNNNNNSKKSDNNNLKSINIENVELSPEFNKDTLEYTSTVEGDVEKITINVELEDGKATVDGDGEKELQEGLNELKISVYAENGNLKEYILKIERKEKDPIDITIDGKKYRVLKRETDMEIPDGFEKETIKINDQEVNAYTNKKSNKTLVVLVDEESNAGFYIYDSKKNTYTKYVELKSKEISLILTNPKGDIPFRYKKVTFTINGQKVDGYYYKAKSKFRLVYGINMENGDEGFYQYDMDQKTFQRFYNEQVEKYTVYAKYVMYGACAAAGLLLILLFFIISLLRKNRKLKKQLKGEVIEEPKKEEKKEEPRALTREERLKQKEAAKKKQEEEEAKESTNEEETEEVDKKALKKEQKRLAKEAKLKEKEEKKLAKQKAKEEKQKEVKEEPKEKEETKEGSYEDFSTKELKRMKKEEEKKLKEEANEFLK